MIGIFSLEILAYVRFYAQWIDCYRKDIWKFSMSTGKK